jgi:hypothetical protein
MPPTRPACPAATAASTSSRATGRPRHRPRLRAHGLDQGTAVLRRHRVTGAIAPLPSHDTPRRSPDANPSHEPPNRAARPPRGGRRPRAPHHSCRCNPSKPRRWTDVAGFRPPRRAQRRLRSASMYALIKTRWGGVESLWRAAGITTVPAARVWFSGRLVHTPMTLPAAWGVRSAGQCGGGLRGQEDQQRRRRRDRVRVRPRAAPTCRLRRSGAAGVHLAPCIAGSKIGMPNG